MVARRLFELYIRILTHSRHWAVITGCPSSTFITCFTEQPDSFGECYYFFLSFIIPALNSLMDQKAHDLGESVIHTFKANLHILLALWLWVKCAVSLCNCRVPGLANKNTWCLVFLFFVFVCFDWLHSAAYETLVPRMWAWKSLGRVQLFATPLEFSRPEYWSG